MRFLGSINSWFTKRVKVCEEEFIIDSLFIYFILDIFSWSFAFEEEKMLDLLNFLRLEKSKPTVGSVAHVQNYIENGFDLALGAYEANCLLKYVGLCGGKGTNQCLLLPYSEEVSKRKWCQRMDQLAIRELFKAQKKNPSKIRSRDLREYRAQVRKMRTSSTCNVRIINRKKDEPQEEVMDNDVDTDHVYDFSFARTRREGDVSGSNDLFQRTQSVIDSINRLNYLSDSASEFSSFSRQSSLSHLSDCGGGGGIFGDDLSLDGSMQGGAFQTEPSHLEELYRTETTVLSFDQSPPI
jgi:hypothetical protein